LGNLKKHFADLGVDGITILKKVSLWTGVWRCVLD